MEYFIVLIVSCFVIYLIYKEMLSKKTNNTETANGSEKIENTGIKKTTYKYQHRYRYQAKPYFMTKAENDFFRMLVSVAGDRYYIFPQTHLSTLLDEKVIGQNWKAAFRHINGKSVDYVLCDKQTIKPVYAVELDDYTHHHPNRQERDQEVERIFQAADMPLVRFSNYQLLTEEEMARRFSDARNA